MSFSCKMNQKQYKIEIFELDSADKHQKCKQVFLKLEENTIINPWACYHHLYSEMTISDPDSKYWFISYEADEKIFAAIILKEESSKRSFITLKILRTLDWHVMSAPGFVAVQDKQEEVRRLFVKTIGFLKSVTKVDMVCFYQLSAADSKQFEAVLGQQNIFFTIRQLGKNQIIRPDELADKINLKKRLRQKRSSEKKIKEKFGAEIEYKRFRGNVFEEISGLGIWSEIMHIWKSSWQGSFVENQSSESLHKMERYLKSSVIEWSEKGWLDIGLCLLDGKIVAANINNVIGNHLWMLMTLYVPELSRFGVGNINLLNTILDSQERGEEIIELGAEAVEWKRRWSTEEISNSLLEISSGSAKALLWQLSKLVKGTYETRIMPKLHHVQSKGEFKNINQLNEQNTSEQNAFGREEITIKLLDSDKSWLSIKNIYQNLEKNADTNPWNVFEHHYCWWKNFAKHKRCWFIGIPLPKGRKKGLMGACILLEESDKRGPLHIKVLRSMDQMTMSCNPFVIHKGYEEDYCFKFADSLKIIASETGADQLAFYRMEENAYRYWFEQLKQRKIPNTSRVFTISKSIKFSDDFEKYYQSLSKNIRKNISTANNRIEKDFNLTKEFVSFRGKSFRDEQLRSVWKEFQKLRQSSWQYENAKDKGLVDTKLVTRYYDEVVGGWAAKGLLHLSVIKIDENVVAGMMGLIKGNSQYLMLTAYNREYKRYSVGLLAFIEQLKHAFNCGDKVIELGGEGSDWKAKYAVEEIPLMQVECSLGTFKGQLWWLAKKIKGSAKNEPLR